MTPWSGKTANGCHDCGTFFLDLVGSFAPGQVRVRLSDAARRTNPDVERAIDEAWREQTERARRDGTRLHDGRVARLIACDLRDQALDLVLGQVSYREFVGTNLTNASLRYLHGTEVLADPLGISAAVTTADGCVVLGRRSEQVFFHAGRVHPIGGMVELRDPPGSLPDLFAQMADELGQELGIARESLRPMTCLGLVRDKGIVQPELIFDARVKVTFDELRASASAARDAFEHTDLVCIREHDAAVLRYLDHHGEGLTPVGLATLLLHGQARWGAGWFATARGYLQHVG